MTSDHKEDGVLSRWARRKAEVEKQAALSEAAAEEELSEAEPEVDPDSEEAAMEVLRERDPELAEQIAGIDIDKLAYEDDFSIFMNKKVPEFIRRRALSKLWLLSPLLANVDGLNDYDEDFTQATSALREFKSAYIPGRGYAREEEDEEDVAAEEDGDEDAGTAGDDAVVGSEVAAHEKDVREVARDEDLSTEAVELDAPEEQGVSSKST